MKTVRVNIRSLANAGAIRREKRNGRDVVIVPSATLPDDIVMNDIMYPADEIEKSFTGLERTPAPLGHPMINGAFVSARDPEGINLGWIGAWNENVRRENGRVFLDKVIDVETASRSEGGKRVLEAANGDVNYKHIARALEFDHDAILLDEQGAATPEQGVGMLVNAKGEKQEVEVINSFIEDADREMDWAVDSLARALERRSKASVLERMKSAIMEAVGLSERVPSTNRKEDDMSVSDEQFKALSDEVKTLTDGFAKIGETIGTAVANAVKPLVDAQNEMVANQKAKEDAEKADLVEKVVKANLLTEAVANTLSIDALKELAPKAEPGRAAALNGAFKPTSDKPGFKVPEGE
ncbi:hypothetical protein [Brucella sp. NBRC 113783]|uniref:hypothetical protein n=1 Tax=Brucella sp. NBRC 113783 TaxID=3075478 RepID=UPI0029BFD1C8|nr:hypothetical protein [Brucella sp. NBRC 113783]MDX4072521.1 hypothetical protein [Brucella sp. NBRC 113783]